MTTALIVLLVAYMIISKIMGRRALNLPERPTDRHPEGFERPRLDYTSLSSEDRPLSGPWDIPTRNQDGPQSGSWDIPTRNQDGPQSGSWDIPARGEDDPLTGSRDKSTRGEDVLLPGPEEPECSTRAGNKPQPPLKWENEPCLPRRQREQSNPAVDPPLALDEQEATSGRRKRNDCNPLAAALRSKNALVGSMIIGEVLNSRGGRIKSRR